MEDISVKLENLEEDERVLRGLSNKVRGIEQAFSSIRYSLDSDIKRSSGIDREMREIYEELNEISNALNRTSVFLGDSRHRYIQAEAEIEERLGRIAESCLNENMGIEVTKIPIRASSVEKDPFEGIELIRNGSFRKIVGNLIKINIISSAKSIFSSIDHLKSLFEDTDVNDRAESNEPIRLQDNEGNLDDFSESILFDGDILDLKLSEDAIDIKDRREIVEDINEILKDYPGYKDSIGEISTGYNGKDIGKYDDAVYLFLHWFEEYHRGNNLYFTYDALPEDYKDKAVAHWVNMIKDGDSISEFLSNLLPVEYYDNMPDIPMYDEVLGDITSENKYESQSAYEYYVEHIFPIDALNEINYMNAPEEVKRMHFQIWARFVYGSSEDEQDEEFIIGMATAIMFSPIKGLLDILEFPGMVRDIYVGIKSVAQDPSQVKFMATFMAKAVVSGEYRDMLGTMVTQAIEEWKLAYDGAEPYEQGAMVGKLIGQVVMTIVETVGAVKGVIGLRKFIKNGGFRKTFKSLLQSTKKIKELIKFKKFDELFKSVKQVFKRHEYYEFVTPDGHRVKINNSDIPEDVMYRLDEVAGGMSELRKPVKYAVSQVKNTDGSILYKLKTKTGKVFDIFYDAEGFPVFDEVYHLTLKSEDLLKSRTTHFRRAGKDLYEKMLNNPSLKSKFTDVEIAKFKVGKVPEKWTWHHHQDTGLMQLVLKEQHEVATHTGGFSIWGPGN